MDNNLWLRGEIGQWLREGLIDDQQAQRLYAKYPLLKGTPSSSQPWGRVIFAALGAIAFGLGIILVFAYNWQALHRFGKLAVLGGGLLLSHGVGLWLGRRQSHPRIADSFHLLGTMLFGAGIWLVGQTYHISGHYPNAFMLWALAATAMCWALPSVAQGMLAAVLLLTWSGLEIFEFHRFHPWASLLMAAVLLPLAWLLRSLPLALVLLLLLPLSIVFTASHFSEALVVMWLCAIATGYLAGARLLAKSALPGLSPAMRRLGLTLLLIMLYLATFTEFSGPSLAVPITGAASLLLYLLAVAFTVTLWVAVWMWPAFRPVLRVEILESVMICVALLVAVLVSLAVPLGGWVVGLANLLVLGFALLLIWQGTESVHFKHTALGCLLLAAWMFARFNDLFVSLLARSAVFLLLGALLFVVGLRYSKRSEQKKIMGSKPHA